MAKNVIIAVILIIAILVGGSGCMFNKQNPGQSNPDTSELALAYLENKYGEPFTHVGPWGNSMTGTREFLVSCNSLPGENIVVQVENFRDAENMIYRDNYLAVKYKEDTMAFFRDCAAKYFENCRVVYEVSSQCQSADLPASADLSAYLADGNAKMVMMVEISAGSFTGKEQIADMIAELETVCGNTVLTVVVVSDDVYGTLTRKELSDLISLEKYECCAIAYLKGSADCRIDWLGEK